MTQPPSRKAATMTPKAKRTKPVKQLPRKQVEPRKAANIKGGTSMTPVRNLRG